MILKDKKFRKELEQQLHARYSGASLNGYIEIAVGEAFSDYHLAIARGEIIHSAYGWIYKNAKNKILNEIERLGHLNRIGIRREQDSGLPSDDNFEKAEEAKLILEEILPLVSEKKRVALLLYEYEGYTLEETAEKLKISIPAVKKRIHEAKSELAKAIKKNK